MLRRICVVTCAVLVAGVENSDQPQGTLMVGEDNTERKQRKGNDGEIVRCFHNSLGSFVEVLQESPTLVVVSITGTGGTWQIEEEASQMVEPIEKVLRFDLKFKEQMPTPVFDSETWGVCLWEASLVLSNYLVHCAAGRESKSFTMKDKVSIELGAGVGLVGMVAALLGAKHSFVSEKQPEVQLLQRCANDNNTALQTHSMRPSILEVIELDWLDAKQLQAFIAMLTQANRSLDYIFIADCVSLDVYGLVVLEALVAVLLTLKATYPSSKIIIAATKREGDGFEHFLELLTSKALPDTTRLTTHICYQEHGENGMCEVHFIH